MIKYKKRLFENRVVIIGGDHHNTLAALRCFGRLGYEYHVLLIVHQADEGSNLEYSKFVRKKNITKLLSEEVVIWLKENRKSEKQIIFTCSDEAEYIIDGIDQELSESYIYPQFKNALGKVRIMMDKYRQKLAANTYGIPMADTMILELPFNSDKTLPEFPLIIKPLKSIDGKKADIKIVKNLKGFFEVVSDFEKLGYHSILIQHFLKKEYEVCSFGCIIEGERHYVGGSVRKIRECPKGGGGSLTFARFIKTEKVIQLSDKIIDFLYDAGYRGPYDIEFLVCENEIYLNEINFRHSGNGYALIQNGVYAPLYWCLSELGIAVPDRYKVDIKMGATLMDEISDLKNIKEYNLSFGRWFIEFITSAKAKYCWYDLSGTYAYYKERLLNLVKRFEKVRRKHVGRK